MLKNLKESKDTGKLSTGTVAFGSHVCIIISTHGLGYEKAQDSKRTKKEQEHCNIAAR